MAGIATEGTLSFLFLGDYPLRLGVITFATADPACAAICAIGRVLCADVAVAGGAVDVGLARKSKVATGGGLVES